MDKTLDSIKLDCEKEMTELLSLQQQRMKQEALVKHFENNNEKYINIVKTIECKVHNILSTVKVFLQLALLSLIESMRSDPDKYISLIYMIITSHYHQQPEITRTSSIIILCICKDDHMTLRITKPYY
jgi:hypothetical protein